MKLWIDNTGLQTAFQCLDGWANPHYDHSVRGLIQLSTLIIFGNQITLNGFEDGNVATKSQEAVERLQTLEIDQETLRIEPIGKEEYGLACYTAAESIAAELVESFNPAEHMLLGGEPPDLPRGVKKRQVEFIRLASEPEGSPLLTRVMETALDDKAIGAVEYMLASSPQLRSAVVDLIASYPDWEDPYSYQLNVFMRYHLNDALADQCFSKYAPAVRRAELIDRRHQYVLDALSSQLDDAVAELRGEPLGIPSVLGALLQRSKGEPEAMIKVAREFREYSTALRNALEKLADRFADDTPEVRFELQQQVKELGHQLRRDLKLEKAATLRDALELRFILGVPVFFISGSALLKWAEQRRMRRRTAVLTEVVKAVAFANSPTDLYGRLRKRSSRRIE
jgi:hypothetical protein